MSTHEFDAVVIGAGPSGEIAAGRLADAGLAVAIVEKHLVAGSCSYYGCMPSKALLRPAQAVAEAKRIPGAAEAVTGKLDVQAVLDRRDEVIHDLDDSVQLPWLEDKGIALFRGTGRLDGERVVVVGDERLEARRAVVLALGSCSVIPPIDGLADVEPWTNVEVTTAKAVPSSLLVLGGGPIGCEMAQAYATLATSVTQVEIGERLLTREEPFASDQVADGSRELGIDLRLGCKVASVRREDGVVTMTLEDGEELTGEEILVAAGRRPPLGDVGLDSVGLGGYVDDGRVLVEDDMHVPGHDWLYAVGDANGRIQLTHMGKYQARIATDHILGKDVELRSDGGASPRVTFTEPQVAAVGHTLASALDAGLAAKAVDVDSSGNAGGSFYGRNAPGTARLVVDTDRDVIVGATITGAEIQDFLHAATIAVIGEVPLSRLKHAVPVFPTRSEIWLDLFNKLGL